MNAEWQRVLDTLRERTNEHNFNLWFRPIRLVSVEDDVWRLAVPNRFLRDWITDNYLDIIERTLYEVVAKPARVSLVVDPGPTDATAASEPPAARPRRPVRGPAKRPDIGMALNSRFVFANFVVGPSNEFAHAACMAVAKQPGKAYNPLFLYGGTGLGKTHLLQAVGHAAANGKGALRVAYVTSERFMNELINSIATNQMAEFRRRYRDQCDILLMDDIQFIAGKTSTQEEFFHTFNVLFESGKQVVVTSDQYPQEIKTLDERLRSRLSSGLVADIRKPDLETRMAILTKKAEADNFSLDDEVLRFLAKNIKSNIRELEGSLIRLEAFASLTGAAIDLAVAKDVLKNFIQKLPRQIACDDIQNRVCKYFQIKRADMLSKSRARNVVVPRQIAMYLVKSYTDLSLSEIGGQFGGKDHSTVIASIQRIERLMAEDMSIRDSIKALEKQLEV
ncbi:MAG: chromosomal replication initiator protein DnaA [Myxococcales bacterium]|nr:MAG: chromosomal replication initiator protein DnaA [Myxococcales bacterium]